MLDMIYSIIFQKHTVFKNDHNFFQPINKSDFSKSIFNKINKYFIKKDIKFNSVYKRKKEENKKVLCSIFTINHLLNIFHNTNKIFVMQDFDNIKDKTVSKKKLDCFKKKMSERTNFLKNIKIFQLNKNIKKFTIVNNKKLTNQHIKTNFMFYQIEQLTNKKIMKNLHVTKLNNKLLQKKNNLLNLNKNCLDYKTNLKNNIIIPDIKINKNNLFKIIQTNKSDGLIREVNFLKNIDKKEFNKYYIENLTDNNLKKFIEWKKIINQKILLSIASKNNYLEMRLKPENLGSIYVTISMKNNDVSLEFISKNNEVRIFLDSYIPFLRDALIKNGMQLEQFTIRSTIRNQQYNHFNKIKTKSNVCKKNIDIIKHQAIDVYI